MSPTDFSATLPPNIPRDEVLEIDTGTNPGPGVSGALAAAMRFYDVRRMDLTERAARVSAEMYLRRKLDGLNADQGACLLADALATRAARRR